MFEQLKSIKNGENSVKEFCDAVRQGIPSAVFGVTDGFKYFLASLTETPVLYVVKDSFTAANAAKALAETSLKIVTVFPKEETLLNLKAFSKEVTYSRIKAAYDIDGADIVVATAESLQQPFPKKIYSFTVVKGEESDRAALIDFLVKTGYSRVDSVDVKGTFSVRGDIVDVFPVNFELPVRVDFFGDEVETLKSFDTESRKTVSALDKAVILQAVENVFDKEDLERFSQAVKNEIKSAVKDNYSGLKKLASDHELSLETGNYSELSVFSPLSDNVCDVFDRLNKETVVIIDEAKLVYDAATLIETEFNERFNALYMAGETFSFAQKNLSGVAKFSERLKEFRICALQTLSTSIPFFNPLKIINPKVSGVANYSMDFKEVFSDVKNWTYNGYFVAVFSGSASRAQRLCSDFYENGIDVKYGAKNDLKGTVVTPEKMLDGFIFHEEKLVVIGTNNLFIKAAERVKTKTKRQAFFSAPETGDYCVHEVHGIGKVLGSKKITTLDGTKDYVAVEYAGGDILYVPVEQMDILARYLGGEKKPKLSKIGGQDFERVKKSVKESIKKMSFDLKKLYGERQEMKGFPFKCDEELESAFDAAFQFEETADQISADRDILKDMSSSKVMDRLVCGDVGFGKTEVAFRAVFRAVANGKQAAMLAPTTILAEQHFNTAKERFKDFGVKIAVLDRFRTAKEQKKILDDLKSGELDFIIGTHRLLSKDVQFCDLGLLVLDEEQRFGVEHKEKIKLLKNNVDTLTLTATPIPRTLHMSLSGIRSISVINTPPKKRLPVQTYVTEESDALIKDAVYREVNRGGQAFILYNRVESINTFAAKVKALLPNVNITVCHGQMEEKAMEDGIMKFYGGGSDVLISTTIIENGIDLPKANTLIVIDADKLGLSTLYQLKGRVGRSDRLAYAYFTFKREKVLEGAAFDRLNAIIEFTEMGSGIKIAMRDLEIRGAGNVLGAEQHGHMDKIGYELYSKLLREELSGKEEKIPELDVRLSAFIPENYIESASARMDAYKEIAEINSFEAEDEALSFLKTSYGDIPEETLNLIKIATVKFMAMKISVSEITVKKDEASFAFDDFKAFGNEKLMAAVDEYKGKVRIDAAGKPKIIFTENFKNRSEILVRMREFLAIAAL